MFLGAMKNDCVFQQSSMAEDMGLEEVRSVQTLIFQGGKHAVHVCTQDCTQLSVNISSMPYFYNNNYDFSIIYLC